ncbi:MAG: Ig-like domain-containing protein [Patescibacteria group bacterium]
MPSVPNQNPVRRAQIQLWLGLGGIVFIGLVVAVYFVFVREATAPTTTDTANINASLTDVEGDIFLTDATPSAGSTVTSLESVSITYSAPINPTTVTMDTFYVLQGVDEKSPGSISLSDDGKTATYQLTDAIVASEDGSVTALTVVVDTTGMQGTDGTPVYVPGSTAQWNVYVANQPYLGD